MKQVRLSPQLIVLITVILAILIAGSAILVKRHQTSSSGSVTVERKSEQAFGDLTVSTGGLLQASTVSPFLPDSTTTETGSLTQGGAGGTSVSAGTAIAPAPSSGLYHFVYTGTPQTLSESHLDVFQRVPKTNSSSPLSQFLAQAGFYASNVGDSGTISQITIRKDDYLFSVDFLSGTASIYLAEPTAIGPLNVTASGSEKTANATAPALPASTLLSISHDFLQKYGISTAGFGSPITDNPFASVFYPLLINGLPVYQAGGDKLGMGVSIDPVKQAVTAVYGIGVTTFDVSSYPAETDFQKILDQTQTTTTSYGGIITPGVPLPVSYAPSDTSSSLPTVDVNLGTPTRAYLQVYTGKDIDAQRTIFVPALAFPVTNPPANYYGTSQIVVPLVTLK